MSESKNWFQLNWQLGYNAWLGVMRRAEEPEDDTLRDYHRFVMDHWGGDYERAAAWAILRAGGDAVSS